jgi:hypothetical protein
VGAAEDAAVASVLVAAVVVFEALVLEEPAVLVRVRVGAAEALVAAVVVAPVASVVVRVAWLAAVAVTAVPVLVLLVSVVVFKPIALPSSSSSVAEVRVV